VSSFTVDVRAIINILINGAKIDYCSYLLLPDLDKAKIEFVFNGFYLKYLSL
jgi:hypothetical protein